MCAAASKKVRQKISLLAFVRRWLTTYPMPIAGKFCACASSVDTHKQKHHPAHHLGPGLNIRGKLGQRSAAAAFDTSCGHTMMFGGGIEGAPISDS